jgi:hypothetical protein
VTRGWFMFIIAKCPHCGYRWWLDAAAVDRRIQCRKCKRLLKVPSEREVPKAVEIVNEAKGAVFVDDAGHTYG